ncbi:MAG TPA: Asp-tRNA(Asn)/Glu-tRNA(Gln) amidotransferase GatCAB subunit B, partial [Planctomycetaceae bacterium]|nr:Asp-tRNA(Asn)/Glu-tRNA(Gln) amidotransferase GatCAB subunit B [Planctomycetaceae bacterium]
PAPVLADLLGRVHRKELTLKSAREVFAALLESGEPANIEQIGQVIAEKGLAIVQDAGAIDAAIAQVIAANPKPVADFKSGKAQAAGALIGQVMKLVKGADPQGVRERLLEQLKSLP